jgi:hypothetical protein
MTDNREEERRVRRPLVTALQAAADCKDCHAQVFMNYSWAGIRHISLEAKVEPCLEHALSITQALAAVEEEIRK